MLALLLACSPTSDIQTGDAPPCDFGFERRDDGACYEIDPDTADPTADDTGATEADADTDADTDSDTDADTTDSAPPADTGPWDADGDGYYASADCDDADPDRNPGMPDDTEDSVDNDCDGAVDEDFDACAAAYGWVEWTSAGGTMSSDWVGGAGWPLEGTATICDLTCNDWWLTPLGIGTGDACTTMETLPYDLSGSTRICIEADDPGTESWGTCDLYTSAGTLTFTYHFQG